MVVSGNIVVCRMINLSSSLGHRTADEVGAAAFIQVVRGLLEYPAALLLE